MPLAVAVLAMIRSKTNAFPLSTVVIEQYRPPIDKYIIGELHTELFRQINHAWLLAELPAGIFCPPFLVKLRIS